MGHYQAGVATWPKGVVPYEIDELFSANETSSQNLTTAIQQINATLKGNVNLRPKNPSDKNWIRFAWTNSAVAGCNSHVGMKGGEQTIRCSLITLIGVTNTRQNSVSVRTCTHEIGHALGLKHEHQRWDRDVYAVFTPQVAYSLAGATKGNFTRKHPSKWVMHGTYDCTSVMHYKEQFFNGVPYFIAKPGGPCRSADFGASGILTRGDISALLALY